MLVRERPTDESRGKQLTYASFTLGSRYRLDFTRNTDTRVAEEADHHA